jgi:hypothetical protein
MKTRLIAGEVIQVDETPVTYLVAKDEGGGSAKGYLWVYRGLNGEIVFDWHTSRALGCLESFLGPDFEGTLQCDDYSVYHSYFKAALLDERDVTLAGCLAHVRRKFDEAKNDRPEVVDWFLRQIGLLYGIEEEFREHGCAFEVRARVRQRRAKSILATIEKAAIHQLQRPGTLPKSPLGKALSHCLGRMPELKVYLEDGRLEIDNNLVENAIRPTAVGKKNHLFFGHAESGIPAANIYSLVISCHKLGGNPQAYLEELIREVPKMTTRDDFASWTPANWVARQKEKESQQESASAAA